MSPPLDDYRAKRDFARTPEPAPKRRARRGDAPVFVVHRHEARRLHYDLRIESGGVLCSWAVPKGFSYDPGDKHLAVRTEDHPLEYEDFDGVIPKGEYGAGTMTIWDRGRYEVVLAPDVPSGMASGELKLILKGRKLRGEWHLVRTRKEENHWLLFKSRDRYAGSARDSALGVDLEKAPEAPFPRAVKKMTAGPASAPFSDPGWLFEMQFEGRRVLAAKQGESVQLRGLRKRLPEVEAGLLELRAQNALLDGVLVALDENERPSAAHLAACLEDPTAGPVHYYAFDLLYYEDFDLRPLPLVDRKGALRAVLPTSGCLLFVDHVPGNGEALCATVARAGLPGVIAKRADSPYVAGKSEAWRAIAAERAAAPAARALTEALARAPAGLARTRVKLTNLHKVFWPAEGFTKGDLIAYYESVADALVPHLVERPVHMNRFPDGIDGKSFYQRQTKDDFPDWIESESIESQTHGEAVPHIIFRDRETLLFLANRASIDIHPWSSRRGSLDAPDWSILDLDPKGAPFSDVVKIARELGKLLRGIGLRPLVKTSGKTGIHVYVPLADGYTYDQSRMFAEGVARLVAREHQELATVERVVGSRGGRVYIDFLQNRRSQTVVPPYSARPVRGATVSTPLAWDELDSALDPSRFTIQTVPDRLTRHGDLFRSALTDRQELLPAIEALQEYMQG